MSNITTNTSVDMFEMMDKAWKFSLIISKSDFIPTHYRNKPENCFIAVQTAFRMNIDPMLVMNNTFVVSGKLGMSTAFALSLTNQSNIFKGPFDYITEGEGNDMKVTAKAVIAKTGKEVSATVTMKMAMDEGWTRNSKYKTMPEHMLIYRAATFLIRRYCPEVINGMHTVEELEDVKAADTKDITPPSKTQSLTDKLDCLLPNDSEKEQLIFKLVELIDNRKLDDAVVEMCNRLNVPSINQMTVEELKTAIDWVEQRKEGE
jgi:hypothetical protein